jgi:hypothetical protein
VSAYGWEDQGSKQVCATDDQDHIILFSQAKGQNNWTPDDITANHLPRELCIAATARRERAKLGTAAGATVRR